MLKWKCLPPVSYVQGLQMQREIGAVEYMECSFVTLEGLNAVFNQAVRTVLREVKRKGAETIHVHVYIDYLICYTGKLRGIWMGFRSLQKPEAIDISITECGASIYSGFQGYLNLASSTAPPNIGNK